MDAFVPLPDATLVRLVNGWGTIPRRVDPDVSGLLPPVNDLIEATPPDVRPLVEQAVDGATPADLAAVADQLFPVFELQPDPKRIRSLNELLHYTSPTPRLDLTAPSDLWAVPSPSERPLAAAVLALVNHLTTHGSGDRLGVCNAERCSDVYIDSSPGRHKRFCSVTCQNRTRVAAFRARRTKPRHSV